MKEEFRRQIMDDVLSMQLREDILELSRFTLNDLDNPVRQDRAAGILRRLLLENKFMSEIQHSYPDPLMIAARCLARSGKKKDADVLYNAFLNFGVCLWNEDIFIEDAEYMEEMWMFVQSLEDYQQANIWQTSEGYNIYDFCNAAEKGKIYADGIWVFINTLELDQLYRVFQQPCAIGPGLAKHGYSGQIWSKIEAMTPEQQAPIIELLSSEGWKDYSEKVEELGAKLGVEGCRRFSGPKPEKE